MWVELPITVQNTTGKELTLRWDGNPVRVQIRDELGNPAVLLGEGDALTTEEPRNWKGMKIEAGWTDTIQRGITFAEPGKYTVRLLIEFHGPFVNRNGVTYEAWEGRIEKVLSLTVQEPQGVDREVYDAFRGHHIEIHSGQGPSRILREYPSSAFASHLVWWLKVRGTVRQDIESTAKRMRSGARRISNSVPCDKPKAECPSNGWRSLQGREYLDWRIRWLRTAIQNHPKMWFTEENQLQLAIDLYMIGDQEAAFAGLEQLKETASVVAVKTKARDVLEAIRLAGTLTDSPVLGFLAVRGPRSLTRKDPKPLTSTFSPRLRATMMLSISTSKHSRACTRDSPVFLATISTRSSFVMTTIIDANTTLLKLHRALDGVVIIQSPKNALRGSPDGP